MGNVDYCAHTHGEAVQTGSWNSKLEFQAGMGLWAARSMEGVPAHGMKCSLKSLPAQTLLGFRVKFWDSGPNPNLASGSDLQTTPKSSTWVKSQIKIRIVSSALFAVTISERSVTVGLEETWKFHWNFQTWTWS